MWMGGTGPLGYQIRDRHLVIDQGRSRDSQEHLEEIMRKGTVRGTTIACTLSILLALPIGPLIDYAAAQSQPAAASTQTQVPQPPDNNVNWSGAGYGAGAVFCSLLYIPFKLTYAILGGLIGGGTYLVTAGNTHAANTVWRSSLGGDWVVTPAILQGQEPLNFSGPTDTPLPSSGTSSGVSSTNASTSPSSGQPLDHGVGPTSGTAGGSNIE
jgi:hypothetical protein